MHLLVVRARRRHGLAERTANLYFTKVGGPGEILRLVKLRVRHGFGLLLGAGQALGGYAPSEHAFPGSWCPKPDRLLHRLSRRLVEEASERYNVLLATCQRGLCGIDALGSIGHVHV